MREWRLIVDEVAELLDETIAAGLFAEETDRHYEVLETFDDGTEFVDTVTDWTGTRISRSLAARAKRVTPPLKIHEGVRLRVLRVL